MMDKIEKLEQHLATNPTDFGGWLNLFDLDDRMMLDEAVNAYPHSIIRLPSYDLMTSGIKGAVPSDWDGSIIHL